MYRERERDTHFCQMLWSFFLSEWSLQVWGGQYCPGQYCPAPASTDTALGTFGTCSKRKQWLQRSDIWRVTQVTSCSRDSPQHRGGGKREREREILLLLLQMFSSRGDSSHCRIKKLELWGLSSWHKIFYLLFPHGYILWFDIIKKRGVKSFNKPLCILGIIIEQLCL